MTKENTNKVTQSGLLSKTSNIQVFEIKKTMQNKNTLGGSAPINDKDLTNIPNLSLEHNLNVIYSQPAIDDDEIEELPSNTEKLSKTCTFWKFTYKKPKPSFYILCALMSVKVLAENLVLGVIMDLTLQKIEAYYSNDEVSSQREFAKFQSVTTVIQSLLGLSLCSKYGHMSDNRGRVFVLKLCGFFTIAGSLANIYIYKDSTSYEFYMFVAMYCVEALNAGTMSLVAIGNSYVSDVVKDEDRMVYISLFMSIMYATIGIGPLIGSFLVKSFKGHNFHTLYVALGLNVLYSLGLQFVLSESRTITERRESQSIYDQEAIRKALLKDNALKSDDTSKWEKLYHLSKLDLLVDLFKPLKHLWIPKTAAGSLIPRINVLILLIIEMLVGGSVEGCVQAIITYSMFRYDWSSVEIGYYYSISGVGRALVLLIGVPKLVWYLKKRNFTILSDSIDKIDMIHLYLFLVFVVLSFGSMIVIESNDFGSYLNSLFISLSAFALPTIQNAIVKYTSKKAIGQVFGALAVLRHLVQLVTPPFYLQVYAATGKSWPTFFLYIPLFLGVLSIFLLQFVKIVNDHEMLRRQSEVFPNENMFIEEDPVANVNENNIKRVDLKDAIITPHSVSIKTKNIPIETTPLIRKNINPGGSIKNSYRSLRNSYLSQNNSTPTSSNSVLNA